MYTHAFQVVVVKSVRDLLRPSFPALFSSLLMRVGTANGVDEGQSSADAVECLRVFLESMGETEMLSKLEKEGQARVASH